MGYSLAGYLDSSGAMAFILDDENGWQFSFIIVLHSTFLGEKPTDLPLHL
jgi:hypothetical protein